MSAFVYVQASVPGPRGLISCILLILHLEQHPEPSGTRHGAPGIKVVDGRRTEDYSSESSEAASVQLPITLPQGFPSTFQLPQLPVFDSCSPAPTNRLSLQFLLTDEAPKLIGGGW